ncbi:hypothetical protein H8B15_00335 [Hymenobacter sp. BT507]|uniref:Uncharacterized protein n=1 Tax=Hymenobacter citatus TaxID=2763506 RepID=A0ABR7ME40_9BACT|nr:hypothetical protein [Hymenobacter citatus]MBC6609350.1 hypothetical protein [Hymenobacter citatus]
MESGKPTPKPDHILRNNLLALLVAAVLAALATGLLRDSIVFMALFAFVYIVQALINITLGVWHLFWPVEGSAAPYFLSALLVLLIGFGACAGMFSMAVG